MIRIEHKIADHECGAFHMETCSTALYLMYHRITKNAAVYPYTIGAREFEAHLNLAREITDDARYLDPVFTFDDGHVSNYTEALEPLARYRFKAMFFITSGWIERRPDFLTWSQVRAVQNGGHIIGSHGWSHKLLTQCSDSELAFEVTSSKDAIEQKLGTRVDCLSIPGGSWDARVLRACMKGGYRRVFTSDPGVGQTIYRRIAVYPRFNVTRSMELRRLRDLARVDSTSSYFLRVTHHGKHLVRRLLGDRLYHRLWCTVHGWQNDEDVPHLV